MKMFNVILFLFFAGVILPSCNSGNRSKEIAGYQYKAEDKKLNENLQAKVGSWIKEDMECYGILVILNKDGKLVGAKEIKAKVVKIESDMIKMKALERVSLAPIAGCNKLGIAKGEIWMEEDGELFQTKEEAIAYIKTNLPAKKRTIKTKKVTVD